VSFIFFIYKFGGYACCPCSPLCIALLVFGALLFLAALAALLVAFIGMNKKTTTTPSISQLKKNAVVIKIYIYVFFYCVKQATPLLQLRHLQQPQAQQRPALVSLFLFSLVFVRFYT
jgi:hypothetical protein